MSEIRTQLQTNERIKDYLRNFPAVYQLAKRFYRLFRKSDPTVQERIVKALSGKPRVFFVQVGSNDGFHGDPIHDLIVSNTSWGGIFIEPVDFLFRRLRDNYRASERFVFENVAIGNERGCKKFYYVSEKASTELDLPYWHDQLGSFDRSHITRALGNQITPFIIEVDVECLPLQDVLDRNGVVAIDVLHIDTEGFDYQVLSQVDLGRYKPVAILFEHLHLTDEEFFKARKLLSRAGYRLLQYGQDTLAIRRG